MPLKARSENQRLHNFYSILHPHLTCTVSHHDYYYYYVHLVLFGMLDFSTHVTCMLTSFSFVALSSLLRTLSSLCRCLSLFFLHFWHDLSIDRFHVYLSVYQWSFCQELQQISQWWNFENSLRKVGHIGLSHGCHVIRRARWLVASRRLMIFILSNIAICSNSYNYRFIFRPNVEIICTEHFFIHFRQNDFRPSTTPLWVMSSPSQLTAQLVVNTFCRTPGSNHKLAKWSH